MLESNPASPHGDIEASAPIQVIPDLSWYALYVRAQQERSVEIWLERAGLVHFSPFITRPIKERQSNLERTEIPLLPGYVFARVDPGEDVSFAGTRVPLVGLPGVVSVVGRGTTPEPIPDIEVESLRILCDAKVSMHSIPLVTGGDYVRVIRGPLTGAEGYVSWVEAPAGKIPKITVSVTMLGRSICTDLQGDWLEKAEPVKTDVGNSRGVQPGVSSTRRG